MILITLIFLASFTTLGTAIGLNPIAVGCDLNLDYYDRDLGHSHLEPFKYCDIRCGRNILGMTCCYPSPPDALNVTFTYYSKDGYSNGRLLDWRRVEDQQYLSQNRIVFIIHGWVTKFNQEFSLEFKDAFLNNQYRNEDVIIINWSAGTKGAYHQSLANTRTVGKMVGKAILNWNIAMRTMLVGHSLGAIVTHEAATYVKENSYDKVSACVGLDPAGKLMSVKH